MQNTETQTQQTHTLKYLAERFAVPESTLRLYRDEFDDLIPTVGSGRRRRYREEGIDTLRRIVEWRREGWSAAEIREALSRERVPRERTRRRNAEEQFDEILARLTAQAGEIAMLRVEVGALRSEVKRLTTARRSDGVPAFDDALSGENAG
jgi:DNA-binding transcriptional MerR regulator